MVGMPMAWVTVTMAVRERRSWKRILGGLLVFELGCCEWLLARWMRVWWDGQLNHPAMDARFLYRFDVRELKTSND